MLHFFIFFLLFYFPCFADHGSANDHAPIAVMADHNHKMGEWMLSFRYGQMNMIKDLKHKDFKEEDFKMSLGDMSMHMGMLGFMYGFTDKFTFMIMAPLVKKDMSMKMNSHNKKSSNQQKHSDQQQSEHSSHTQDHAEQQSEHSSHTQDHAEQQSEHSSHTQDHAEQQSDHSSHIQDETEQQSNHPSQIQTTNRENSKLFNYSAMSFHSSHMAHFMSVRGFGDIKAGGLFTLYESKQKPYSEQKLILYIGASLPTGSIKKGLNKNRYPYSMQLGSGTVDPIVSSTYHLKRDNWSVGVQAQGFFRFYKNSLNYKLGNEYKGTAWLAYNLLKEFSLSSRIEYKNWGQIQGADSVLDKKASPSKRPDFYSGESLVGSLGFNFYRSKGFFKNNRLAFEWGMPIYQKIKLPMKIQHYLMLGWQLSL